MKLDGTRKFLAFIATQVCLTILGIVGTIDSTVCVSAISGIALGYLGVQGYLDSKKSSSGEGRYPM